MIKQKRGALRAFFMTGEEVRGLVTVKGRVFTPLRRLESDERLLFLFRLLRTPMSPLIKLSLAVKSLSGLM